MSGRPTSSTTASGSLRATSASAASPALGRHDLVAGQRRARAAARRAARGRRRRSGSSPRPLWLARQRFFGDSYARSYGSSIHSGREASRAMRRQRRTRSSSPEGRSRSPRRHTGSELRPATARRSPRAAERRTRRTALMVERGGPCGFTDLADRLGVDAVRARETRSVTSARSKRDDMHSGFAQDLAASARRSSGKVSAGARQAPSAARGPLRRSHGTAGPGPRHRVEHASTSARPSAASRRSSA